MVWKKVYNHILFRVQRTFFLRPIHVFVFHHVSDVRDPLISAERDWTKSDVFFSNIRILKKKYHFITLEKAYLIIKHEHIRWRNYAVLTTDDGLQTVPFVFPWLEKHDIPLTCFINAKYMDGHSFKDNDLIRIKKVDKNADVAEVIKKQYMTKEQVFSLCSPLITIASHGYEHLDAANLSSSAFYHNISECIAIISNHPRFIPFHAYAWGRHSKESDRILLELKLIPVLVDGQSNLNDCSYIHRECIDGISL